MSSLIAQILAGKVEVVMVNSVLQYTYTYRQLTGVLRSLFGRPMISSPDFTCSVSGPFFQRSTENHRRPQAYCWLLGYVAARQETTARRPIQSLLILDRPPEVLVYLCAPVHHLGNTKVVRRGRLEYLGN